MKVGVIGGTFDPVHIGHLILSETIRCTVGLDKVIFMPAARPPHKLSRKISRSEFRLDMLKFCIVKNKGFEVSDYEIKKKGISYTIDTIQELKRVYKLRNKELYFIIGADNLVDFKNWKNPEQILNQVNILVLNRSGIDINKINKNFLEVITLIKAPLIDISSSDIRERVRKNKSIHYLVTDEVEKYIYQKDLYI